MDVGGITQEIRNNMCGCQNIDWDQMRFILIVVLFGAMIFVAIKLAINVYFKNRKEDNDNYHYKDGDY